MSYNREWILNKAVKQTAAKLSAYKWLNESQQIQVGELFREKFYSPNIYVRIGLFIFTLILANAALGIVGSVLFSVVSGEVFFGLILISGSIILLVALRHFIKAKYHFRSGMDDCLLYMAVVFGISGIVVAAELSEPLNIAIICLPILIAASIIYADSFLSLLSFICLYVIVFLTAIRSDVGTVILPFVYFGVSIFLVLISTKLLSNDGNFYWNRNLKVLRIVSLISVFLSVNYFVVKEGNMALNSENLYLKPTIEMEAVQKNIDSNNAIINNFYSGEGDRVNDEQLLQIEKDNQLLYTELDKLYASEYSQFSKSVVPFGFYFLLLTGIIPIIYILYGFKRKDRILLNCGIIILVASFVTYHYYFSFYAYEYFITLSGMLFIVTSWYSIKYLRKNNDRFTFDEELTHDKESLKNIEAIATIQTMGQTPLPVDEGVNFGGGKFGGGGAGGGF